MKVLDIPIDALAFNYVSFGLFTLVNNLWTWVAVVTAAVSFWSIKIKAAAAASVITPPKSDPPQIHDIETEASSPSSAVTELPAASTVAAVVAAVGAVGDEGARKGKFRMYYENERVKEGEVEAGGGGEWAGEREGGEYWWWEARMRMRMGELGWYRWQDRRVVNGSVVRLWDVCEGRR